MNRASATSADFEGQRSSGRSNSASARHVGQGEPGTPLKDKQRPITTNPHAAPVHPATNVERPSRAPQPMALSLPRQGGMAVPSRDRLATPSLPDALALAIRLAVKRQARLRDESRRNIHVVEQPDRRA
jgi:hypothetical protein